MSSTPERGAVIIIKAILVRDKLFLNMDPFYFMHKRRYDVISATVINTGLERRRVDPIGRRQLHRREFGTRGAKAAQFSACANVNYCASRYGAAKL